MNNMAYDKLSFLSGVAAGRNMASFPAMEGEPSTSFFIDTHYNLEDGLTYGFRLSVDYFGDGAIIEWGDGTSESVTVTGIQQHTYSVGGVYQITIKGTFTGISFTNWTTSTKKSRPECLIAINNPFNFDGNGAGGFGAYDMFRGCTHLIRLPSRLFYKCNTFYSRSGIGQMFYGCSSLKTLPKNLFDGLLELPYAGSPSQNDNSIFKYCTALESVPADLFDYDDCYLEDPEDMFYGCIALKAVPERLFSRCTRVRTFKYCFLGCASLENVGDAVFDGCFNCTTFQGCFSGCSSLRHIPVNTFAGCSAVTGMISCFNSSGLTEIPAGIFDDMTSCGNWQATFSDCYSLTTVPVNLFTNIPDGGSFQSCFSDDYGITSLVPDLWNTHSSASHSSCYRGCTNAANYSQIPADWGGPT